MRVYILYIHMEKQKGGCTEGGWLGMLAVRDASILPASFLLSILPRGAAVWLCSM